MITLKKDNIVMEVRDDTLASLFIRAGYVRVDADKAAENAADSAPGEPKKTRRRRAAQAE